MAERPMMRLRAAASRLALIGVLAASLGGCGHSSATKVQKPIAGCDIPSGWAPDLILEDMVTEGFHAENAVKDPDTLAELNSLYANGHPGDSPDFEKWFGENGASVDITVRGVTMFNWDLFLRKIVFPRQAEVYPAVCGGWTLESYLHQHPEVDNAYIEAKLATGTPTDN